MTNALESHETRSTWKYKKNTKKTTKTKITTKTKKTLKLISSVQTVCAWLLIEDDTGNQFQTLSYCGTTYGGHYVIHRQLFPQST